jgi:hypothetical protein
MYIRFLKLNLHCALFILQQALYNSNSKKKLDIFTKFVCKALCFKKMYKFVCQSHRPFLCLNSVNLIIFAFKIFFNFEYNFYDSSFLITQNLIK